MSALSSAPARVGMLVLAAVSFVGTWDHRPREQRSNRIQEIAARRDAQYREMMAARSPHSVVDLPAVIFDQQPVLVAETVAADSGTIKNSINLATITESKPNPEPIDKSNHANREVLWHDPRFQLPHAITPGQYRIVDNLGNVDTLVLTKADLEYQGIRFDAPSEDMYKVIDGELRWYFIRIESSDVTEPQASLESPSIETEFVLQ